MYYYNLFGRRLQSTIRFPELREEVLKGGCDWRLEVRESPRSIGARRFLGECPIAEGVSARLYQNSEGFHLEYDDTGIFEVSSDGRRMFWTPTPAACADSARLDLIGIVMAVALHAGGVFTLHGSAVATGSGVLAFIGPRFYGKSTLAAGMVAAGAQLVTDDSLAVMLRPSTVIASPGTPNLRLWKDSFERLSTSVARGATSPGGKRLIKVRARQTLQQSTRLEAVYLLHPMTPDSVCKVARREPLEPVRSALALATQAKLAILLDGADLAADLLRQAGAIARVVPIYVLDYARDLDRADQVVEALLNWHPLGTQPGRAGYRTRSCTG